MCSILQHCQSRVKRSAHKKLVIKAHSDQSDYLNILVTFVCTSCKSYIIFVYLFVTGEAFILKATYSGIPMMSMHTQTHTYTIG